MRIIKIPKTAIPPIAIPTMAPVGKELSLPDPASVELVSVGVELRVVVRNVDGIVSPEEGVLGVGVRMGDLSVTIVVFLVTVTLELFGMVRVVPESVMVPSMMVDSLVSMIVMRIEFVCEGLEPRTTPTDVDSSASDIVVDSESEIIETDAEIS